MSIVIKRDNERVCLPLEKYIFKFIYNETIVLRALLHQKLTLHINSCESIVVDYGNEGSKALETIASL